ncbi:hypothetical protein [Clostridium muellerianum]|uniref:hypothetical protein n=1 Tax=Clostridium muellerianum TaxID=2716538 RepID=UPI001FACC33D|nr:hypothetical protein [Clostridium muellerianum]
MIKVDKNIAIGENKLYLDNVTITPDRVLISGSSKGFSSWENNKNVNYYYDVVDENGDSVPLKEEIGKGAYFCRFSREGEEGKADTFKEINTLKIVPYTFNKISTNTTVVCDGRIRYIIEDKIITIDLKNKVYTNNLISK